MGVEYDGLLPQPHGQPLPSCYFCTAGADGDGMMPLADSVDRFPALSIVPGNDGR